MDRGGVDLIVKCAMELQVLLKIHNLVPPDAVHCHQLPKGPPKIKPLIVKLSKCRIMWISQNCKIPEWFGLKGL